VEWNAPGGAISSGLGDAKHDGHGRVISVEYAAFHVVMAYVPNSGEKLQKLDYRIKEWEVDMNAHLKVSVSCRVASMSMAGS
jgi:exonuclease III